MNPRCTLGIIKKRGEQFACSCSDRIVLTDVEVVTHVILENMTFDGIGMVQEMLLLTNCYWNDVRKSQKNTHVLAAKQNAVLPGSRMGISVEQI